MTKANKIVSEAQINIVNTIAMNSSALISSVALSQKLKQQSSQSKMKLTMTVSHNPNPRKSRWKMRLFLRTTNDAVVVDDSEDTAPPSRLT